MATIKNGILGGFTGKVGSVVGYRTYGVDRMRSISERTAPATAAELKNRKQFKLVQDTLNCIKSLIKIGFKDYWTKTGGIRGAVSYNKTQALQVTDDDCLIVPERFKFSGGPLPGLKNTNVVLERPDLLRFNWDSAASYEASPKDQVMLLAIDLEGKKACYESLGNFRSSGTDVLNLDHHLAGKAIDIYIAVVAKDRSKQADSQYLGRMIVPSAVQVEMPVETPVETQKEAVADLETEDRSELKVNLPFSAKEAEELNLKETLTQTKDIEPPGLPFDSVAASAKPLADNHDGFTVKKEQVGSPLAVKGAFKPDAPLFPRSFSSGKS